MSAALKRVEAWLGGIPFEAVWCNGACVSVRDLREVVRLARQSAELRARINHTRRHFAKFDGVVQALSPVSRKKRVRR